MIAADRIETLYLGNADIMGEGAWTPDAHERIAARTQPLPIPGVYPAEPVQVQLPVPPPAPVFQPMVIHAPREPQAETPMDQLLRQYRRDSLIDVACAFAGGCIVGALVAFMYGGHVFRALGGV